MSSFLAYGSQDPAVCRESESELTGFHIFYTPDIQSFLPMGLSDSTSICFTLKAFKNF